MRIRIWNNLVNIKFKALYCERYSAFAGLWGSVYSFIIVLGSSGSVAAWAIWKQVPGVWAAIVGLSQFLHILKTFIPIEARKKRCLRCLSSSKGFIFNMNVFGFHLNRASYPRKRV